MHRTSPELEPLEGPDDCVNPGGSPKRFLKVRFDACPIGLSLGVLGRKWSLLLLRNIGAYRIDRFNQLRRSLPGIPPKVLSERLAELEAGGLIHRVETRRTPRMVRWDLTRKGKDLVPVMMMLTAFQSKWNAERLHPGRPPMRLAQMYDGPAMRLLGQFL